MPGRATTLRGAPGVDDPHGARPRHLGHVRVAVRYEIAAREGRRETFVASARRARVVDETDAEPLGLDDPALGELSPESGLVHVPEYSFHRSERA